MILDKIEELLQILIVVSDTHNIPDSLAAKIVFRDNLVSVKEGYLGCVWSHLIYRIYSLNIVYLE